jgi:hypothetical protein
MPHPNPDESPEVSDQGQAAATKGKQGMFVTSDGRNVLFTFVIVSSLFLLWGFCNGMIDVMDKHFQEELHLNLSQSAWVQFAHYLGYFLMSLPAGWLATKFGYKGGIIFGLLLVAVGGFWFIPATKIVAFWAFLLGVCLIAGAGAVRGDAHQPRPVVQRDRLDPGTDSGGHLFLLQGCGRQEHGQPDALDSLRRRRGDRDHPRRRILFRERSGHQGRGRLPPG